MGGYIYMIKKDDELIPIEEEKHARELDFQKLIKKYPDLIPGDQIDSEDPRRWLYIGEEVHFPTLGGGDLRLDLLFLDQDGIPTLVELKRGENKEIKREVVSQIMEYGANILLSMDIRGLRKMLEENNDTTVSEFLNKDESEEDEFWEIVYGNLKAEKIRLLIIADEIPNRLQNTLEFLNRNMESVEILSVEIKQYCNDNEKTLVSRVIGQSIEAKSIINDGTRSEVVLNKKAFFEHLDKPGNEFFTKLFKYAKKEQLLINCGTKGFSLNIPINGNNISIFRGYCDLAADGQRVESTNGYIKRKVKNGDQIVNEYTKEIVEVEGFYEVGDGFMYKIEKSLDDENWTKFENIITAITSKIRENGLD